MITKIKKLLASLLIVSMLSAGNVGFVYAQEVPPTQEQAPVQESAPQPNEALPQHEAAPTPSDPTPSPEQQTQSNQTSSDQANTNNTVQSTSTVSPTPSYPIEEGEIGRTVSNTSAAALGVNHNPNSGSGIGDVSVNTGNATTNATGTTGANNNLAGAGPSATIGEGSGSGASVVNSGNGSESDNSGSASILNNNNTNQNNSAVINNNLVGSTTTGSNAANDNTGGNAAVTSGDANTTGTLITAVNTNAAGVMVSEFNIAEDHMGDYVLDFAANCILGCGGGSALVANTGNGSGSDNDANLDVTNNNNTFQNNDANIGNTMVLDADSGRNSASDNTGGDSSITSGDANVAANALTFANNNIAGNVIYGVVNVFGDLVGDIIFPEDQFNACCAGDVKAANTGNGSGSTNDSDVLIDNNDSYFQNNGANIVNNLSFDATTGNNATSDNTGGNSTIETGNTNVDANLLNIANANIIGGNWWLVVVNEAGNWVGKIMGADGQNFAGSAGTDFQVDENGFITAAINSGNGSGSDNNASVSQENNNTTTQNNNADIVNNLDLSANTGYNRATDNTGGNSNIKTGDANVIANLVNFVNNNIVGNGKLMVTVVNVFGSWTGDFIGPGQKKENKTTTQSSNQSSNNSGGTGGSNASNSSSTNKTSQNTSNNGTVASTGNSSGTVNSGNSSGNNFLSFFGNGSGSVNNEEVAGAEATTLVKNAKIDKNSLFNADTKEKLTINLAWLIILAPVVLLFIHVKKFVARLSLPRR